MSLFDHIGWSWFIDYTGYEKPMQELTLKRIFDNQWCTIGKITMDGFECDCIELPRMAYNGSNVRIPAGKYSIRPYKSPRWGKEVPLLVGVKERSFIEIHPCNWAIRPSDGKCMLEGCIAPGRNASSVSVDDSLKTFNELMAKLDFKGEVWITIHD